MKFLKNKRRILIACSLSIAILLSVTTYIFSINNASHTYKDKLIRLHVIANSDSPEDQELKLKVRDEIISKMNEKLGNSKSIDETRELVKENIDEIREIALKEIQLNKKDYDVKVSLGNQKFPTKSYGGFTLPAGEYEALKVVIGEGKGQNWWCVMFPPLCFIDVTKGITDSKTKEEMRKALTEEEFKLIISEKDFDEKEIVLKSKIFELIEKSKIQFEKIFLAGR